MNSKDADLTITSISSSKNVDAQRIRSIAQGKMCLNDTILDEKVKNLLGIERKRGYGKTDPKCMYGKKIEAN